MSAALAYCHSLSMIALGALLFAQLLTFDQLREKQGLRRFLQMAYGIVAAVVLAFVSGIGLLIWTANGSGFYLHNPVFYIKLAVFAAMLLVAVTPVRIINGWRRATGKGSSQYPPPTPSDSVPQAEPDFSGLVRRYLTVELLLFLVIPLAASLAARGIGIQVSAS